MYRTLAIVFVLALSSLGGCTKNIGLRDDQAWALFRASGAEQQLLAVKQQIFDGLDQRSADIAGTISTALRATINQQFDDGVLSDLAVETIREKWHSNYGQTTLNWLNSDIGRKITALEKHAASIEGLAELEEFSQGLENFRPDDMRVALVQRLNESVNGTEMAVDSSLAIALAIAVGAGDAGQDGESVNIEKLRQKIFSDREMLLVPMNNAVLVYFLHSYASLQDTEILEYVDFLESPAGRWYVEATGEAFVKPLISLCMTLGKVLKDTIARQQSTTGA